MCAIVWHCDTHSFLFSHTQITMDQIIALGNIGRDCVATDQLPLSRVCHCVTATLAALSSHPDTALLIMITPEDNTLLTLLLLVEVSVCVCMCVKLLPKGALVC